MCITLHNRHKGQNPGSNACGSRAGNNAAGTRLIHSCAHLPAVATSQQTEDDAMEEKSETEENEYKIEENENDSEENDNDLERNEPETEKTEPEEEQMDDSEDEESETGIPEEKHEAAAVDEPEEVREDEKTEGDEVSSLVERIAEESMDIARFLKNREVRTVLQYKTIAIDAKTLVKHIETLIKLVS